MTHRARPARHANRLDIESEPAQHLPRDALDIEHAQQHMVARHVVGAPGVRESQRLFRARESRAESSATTGAADHRRPTVEAPTASLTLLRAAASVTPAAASIGGRVTVVRQEPEQQVLGADALVTELPRFGLGQDDRTSGRRVEALQVARIGDIASHHPMVVYNRRSRAAGHPAATQISGVLPDLGEPTRECAPFGVVAHQLQRPPVGVSGLIGSPESHQQLGSRRVQVSIVVERELIDDRETGLGALHLGHRDGSVQLDHRRLGQANQLTVQNRDVGPVARLLEM